jgi:hypothetical protein
MGTTQMYALRLIKLVIYLFIICHLLACMWNYIVEIQPEDEEESWNAGVSMKAGENYMTSLYYILVTVTTIGYGDVTAKTNSEIAFVVFLEFIGILFFANLTSNITSILLNLKMKEIAKYSRIHDLDIWLLILDRSRQDKRIQGNLLNYIRDYYTYVWDNDYSDLANSDYMYRLPPSIRNLIIKKLFRDETELFSLFFSGCPDGFKYDIVMNMHPRRFGEKEEIITEGSEVDTIYFVWSGSVDIGTKSGCQIYLRLPCGSFFGEEFVVFQYKASHTFM